MNAAPPPDTDRDDDIPPSKTRRKKQMLAAQELGESLLELRPARWQQLKLPDDLVEALEAYQRLPNRNEARRRQLQYIGKLMRRLDHESIREKLEALHRPDPAEARRGQRISQWADWLLEADNADEHISTFLNHHPAAERQALRQILRAGSSDDGKTRRRLLDHINPLIHHDSPPPPSP